MIKILLIISSICLLGPSAQAGYYLGILGARMSLDFQNVKNGSSVADTSGNIELAGAGGGYLLLSPGNIGFDIGLAFMGTNSQRLNPNPDWGTPWFYRIDGKINYTFSFGLFFQAGVDLIGSFYQEVESHYFGVGALLGLGYRINERLSVSVSGTNSSILFSGQNNRVLRGQFLELNYSF